MSTDLELTAEEQTNIDAGLNKNGTPKEPRTILTEEEKIEAAVAARVAKAKESLDKAFAERDDARKQVAAFEEKERQAELKRLEEAGEYQKAAQLRVDAAEAKAAEIQARLDASEARTVELTRDNSLRAAMSTYTFRSEKAHRMAFDDIVEQLVKDKDNNWVHKSSISIEAAVKAFADDEANSFLFKAKTSSGSGDTAVKKTDVEKKPTSLFQMSQADVLAAAAKGSLRKERRPR
jgi:hypothetical protein